MRSWIHVHFSEGIESGVQRSRRKISVQVGWGFWIGSQSASATASGSAASSTSAAAASVLLELSQLVLQGIDLEFKGVDADAVLVVHTSF